MNIPEFKDPVPALPLGAGMSEELFPKTVLSKTYWLDTRRWLDGSYMNPAALFELFGEFSNDDGKVVRRKMIRHMGINREYKGSRSRILKRAWIALHMHGLTADEWASNMLNTETPGDEIALYALCHMYNRHVMVYSRAHIWSTVDSKMTEEELNSVCDIKLLFIEDGVFGELKTKPYSAAPHTPVFESALTITLRDKKLGVNHQTMPIDLTVSGTHNQPQQKSESENEAAKTDSDPNASGNNYESDDTGYNTQRLLPLNKMCFVNLVRLSDTTILKWKLTPLPSAGVSDHEKSELDQKTVSDINNNVPVASDVPGYNLRVRAKPSKNVRFARKAKRKDNYCETTDSSDPDWTNKSKPKPLKMLGAPSAARLAAHNLMQKKKEELAAEALLELGNTKSTDASSSGYDSSSSSLTNTVGPSSSSRSTRSTSSGKSECTELNAISTDTQDLDILDPDSSSSDEPSTSSTDSTVDEQIQKADPKPDITDVTPKGKLVTVHHRLKRIYKRKRKFNCEHCAFKASSQGELNRHHIKKHGILKCAICSYQARTPSAYRKHMYEHCDEKLAKHQCKDCDEKFPFASQLKHHRIKHLKEPQHQCITCKKWFKNKGDLSKHVVKHTDKKWYCNKCKYKTDDPRNLKAHRHSHGDNTRYSCKKCSKGFNHYMQLKRHLQKNSCVSKAICKVSNSPEY